MQGRWGTTSSPSGLSMWNLMLLLALAEDTARQVCLDQPFLPPCREFLPSLADTVQVLPSREKLAPLILLATLHPQMHQPMGRATLGPCLCAILLYRIRTRALWAASPAHSGTKVWVLGGVQILLARVKAQYNIGALPLLVGHIQPLHSCSYR